jgi:murein DD-endopeptidase MepM/ murein hydrolase activator NlpD
MDLKFKFQRNEEAQLQKLFARHQRKQNRKHIVEEKIEIKRARKEAFDATQNFRKTGQYQIATAAIAEPARSPLAKIADKAAYNAQKGMFSLQSVFLYLYYSLLDSLDSVKQRKAIYIAGAALIALSGISAAAASRLFGYEIVFNGYNIGYVRDIETFNRALSSADARLREWYHNDTVFYERVITKISAYIGNKGKLLLGEEECVKKIYSCNIPIFAEGGVIMVDGQESIRMASVAEAEYAKDNLSSGLTKDDNVVSETIVTSVPQQSLAVVPKTVEMTSVKSVASAIAELTSDAGAPEEGDHAQASGSLAALIEESSDSGNKGLSTSLNFRNEEFAVGEVARAPRVTFNTVKLVKYQEPIKYSKEYKKDASLLEGTSKVIQDGKNGVMQLEAVVAYSNNVEVSRQVSRSETIMQPINQIIAQGTREIEVVNDGSGSGGFIIPVSGRVTSFTSSRTGSHSSYHAIDIACPVGTKLKAAKDGVVTMADWYGDYGKCVIVKHSDGYSTLYAHLSSFPLSTGDTVRQGDTVAVSGNTGRTTGPHLHFEIRKNDNRLDLRSFFSIKEGQRVQAGLGSN